MFEFSIVKKYLVPKRKQLSVSLIATMSVLVITLVVWLLFLFLSITEGIEKNWLHRLTALNAPIRILPKEEYYGSYYYQIDSLANASNYSLKSIRDKLLSTDGDPYNPEVDEEIPPYWPQPEFDRDGKLINPVKGLFSAINEIKDQDPALYASDYEVTGAMLRLRLIRNLSNSDDQSFLTQVSYVSTLPEDWTALHSLLEKPTADDINHLLYLADGYATPSVSEAPGMEKTTSTSTFAERISSILNYVQIDSFRTKKSWRCPSNLLPKNTPFKVAVLRQNGSILGIMLGKEAHGALSHWLQRTDNGLILYESTPSESSTLSLYTPILIDDSVYFKGNFRQQSIKEALSLSDLQVEVKGSIQGHEVQGMVSWDGLSIEKCTIDHHFSSQPSLSPPWYCTYINGSQKISLDPSGVILPKNFRENGVKLGDQGFLSYGSFATSSLQEQRVPVTVHGFYDPGLMAVGTRPILANPELVQMINQSSHALALDPMLANGIQVWVSDLGKTREIAHNLNLKLEEQGLSKYWDVKTFYEYDFAKDLMSQFQSDRYLFTLIGLIILVVACTNIISFLLLLVHAKKKEIGILQALGASKKSIALIFGLAGGIVGILSCILGAIIGFVTLQNLEGLVHFLSFLQGQEALNPAFYGNSLPKTPSQSALALILIATPLISLLAGLIPAIKACKLLPAKILRSE